MKKKLLKSCPVRLAGPEARTFKADGEHKRLAVPEIFDTDNEQILVLNIYRPEDIEAGRLAPAYRIFQTRNEFIMEDLLEQKWRTACWKNFHEKDDEWRWRYTDKWNFLVLVNDGDGKTIREFFDSGRIKRSSWDYEDYNECPLLLIRDVQSEILEKRCERRRAAREREINTAMEGIGPCDKQFLRWAEEEGLYWSRFIFYKYTRRKQINGVCTHCGQEVTMDRSVPRHNREGICPLCKSPVTFIAAGRKPQYMVHWARVSKLERLGEKILYREFELRKSYLSIEPKDWRFRCGERIRTIFDERGNDRSYQILTGYYMEPVGQWRNKMYPSNNGTMLYPAGLTDILAGTMYEHCALDRYLAHDPRETICPAGYLTAFRICPSIEYFTKLGMFKMAKEIMKNNAAAGRLLPGSSLKEILGIRSDRELQLARSNMVNLSDFQTIQKMLKNGIDLKDQEFVTLIELYKYRNDFEDLNEILPLRKLCSYIAKQVAKKRISKGCRLDRNIAGFSEAEKREHRAMLDLWCDYIRFCREVGYELESIPVLCPGDLGQAHDRLYWEYQDVQDRKKRAEQKRKDRKLNAALKGERALLSGKIKNKKYELVIPRSAADIRREGRILGHCVGSYTDMVLNGKCQIYFIRKAGELQTPYYTAEWRDGKIVQCRGKMNCGYNAEMGRFLSFTQRKLKKLHEAAKAA